MEGPTLAVQGLLSILLSLVFITLSWFSLQSFKFDLFFNRPNGAQAKILLIFISIALGHAVASFFMDYLGWSLMLKTFF